MFPLIVLFMAFWTFFAFVFIALMVFFIWRFISERRKKRKARLLGFQRRMKVVISELFDQINEIDTASKYVGLDRDMHWVRSYQDALTKLLLANDNLDNVTELAASNEHKAAQESLLMIARAALQVHRQLSRIRPQEDLCEMPAEKVVETTETVVETVIASHLQAEVVETSETTEVEQGHVIKITRRERKSNN